MSTARPTPPLASNSVDVAGRATWPDGGGIDNQAAFRVAQRAGGGAVFARTWAMSFARRPKPYGDDWEMRGIGLRPPSGADLTEIHVGSGLPLPQNPRGRFRRAVPSDRGRRRGNPSSRRRLRRPAVRRRRGGAPVPRKLIFEGKYSIRYCVHECSSTCSDGSELDDRMVVAEPGAAIFAFTGGADGAEMEVQQLSVEEACSVRGYPCIYKIP